ncbi:LADA_0F12420g1_1 [Lachancea dasiensis]|uniref:LADA_0F12420g1_1 n=1 Tax=Lachancea dasiensis TaxID=1072105 RepID=A0A1G4JMP2_9SACH|nr:LADA_0F12420g1_1 [Lachancea dasiensis]
MKLRIVVGDKIPRIPNLGFNFIVVKRSFAFQRRSIHRSQQLWRNAQGDSPLRAPGQATTSEQRLERNPEFQKMSETFKERHLKQSETEENDSYQLGASLHRSIDQIRSHTHSHSQSTPLLVLNKKEFQKNPGVRITWIGLMINVGMAAGKFVGGIVFHSQALIADAVHAVSDLVSDFLTLFAIKLSSKTPTQHYPFGFGKVQTLGSLAVSAILATAGLTIGWSSLCAIVGPWLPQAMMNILSHSHSHSHGVAEDVTDVNAAWIAAGSIVVKEWIFRATKKVAKETNSNVLLANAWHHRVDSLTSLVAFITISSGYFFNIQSLDAVGGLVVSGLVVKAGADGLFEAMKELIDKAVSKDDTRYIEVERNCLEILSKMVSNNNSGRPYHLNNLIVMASGPNVHAKMVLEVPRQRWENVLTTKEFENVTEHVRSSLRANIPSLLEVDAEYIEERPATSPEQSKEFASQEQMDAPPLPKTETSKNMNASAGRHTHSHFGSLLDDHHTHKH